MAVDNLWLLWYAVGAREDPLAMAGKRSTLKGHKPGSVLRFCLAGGLGAAPPDWQRRGLMPQSASSPYRERRKHLPMPRTSLYWPGPEGA